MKKTGNILIADDETTFLESTADLLRLEGYRCVCAGDAHQALERLRQERFDLLIADIRMPGNHDLALVKEIARQGESLAIILATGYPNVHSAIDAVNLSVSAYLVKPFDCDELFDHVDKAIGLCRQEHSGGESIERQYEELKTTLNAFQVETNRAQQNGPSRLSDFMNGNLLAITKSVIDLHRSLNALKQEESRLTGDACLTLGCHRPQRLVEALRETVAILHKTRNSFKSKELAELRRNLEALLAQESLTESS